MREVQEAVRDYLQKQTGVHTVRAPARHTGEYPLLAVEVDQQMVNYEQARSAIEAFAEVLRG